MINIQDLVDNSHCYETIRNMRWANGVLCVQCGSSQVNKNGHTQNEDACHKYICKDCGKQFDDLTNTIFAGHHQPVKTWVLCLYFMGLNLSNRQISQELDLNESDVFKMTTVLRSGVLDKSPDITLSGEVEMDEVYVVAGHKGQPEVVKKKDAKDGVTG